MLLLALFIYLAAAPDIQAQDPCNAPVYIDSIYARMEAWLDDLDTMYDNTFSLCDNHFVPQEWYRSDFSVDLLTEPPDRPEDCKTDFAVWMNGTIPDISEGNVSRNVCIASRGELADTCIDQFEIQVKNCGGFRVYQLPPVPYCEMAYCFAAPDPCYANKYIDYIYARTMALEDPMYGDNSLCDSHFSSQWLRTDLQYNYQYQYQYQYQHQHQYQYQYIYNTVDILTEPPVMPEDCRTEFPVWMNGTIPDISEGIVSRNVCIASRGELADTCIDQFEIQVKNCGEFRVYKLPPVPYCDMAYCFAAPDPCYTNNYIDYIYARTMSMEDPMYGDHSLCDSYFSSQWLRTDSQYQYLYNSMDILTEPPVMPEDCRTEFPVWMNGSIPDISEGIVSRTACVASYGEYIDTCIEQIEIQVKNCGGFRVYKLPPVPYCDMAYCIGATQWDPCDATRVLNNLAMRASSEQVDWLSTADTYNVHSDNNLVTDWYRLEGHDMPTYPPESRNCSIERGIWLNGNIPNVLDGVVERTACSIPWDSNFRTCQSSYNIKIKNCGDYRVYRLQRIWNSDEAYCFDPTSELDTTSVGYLCDTTRVLPDMDLRLNADGTGDLCDVELDEAWYRMVKADMPINPPKTWNNPNPHWMRGNIPKESDGIVGRTTCGGTDRCSCSDGYYFEMKNCGDFRIYKLPSLYNSICPTAYSFVKPAEERTAAIEPFEPCDAVVTLENIEQRHTSNRFNSDIFLDYNKYDDENSDRFLQEQWYRMDGYDMPTFDPGWGMCGTHSSIWMNGPVPHVSEGSVIRTACVSTCYESFEITVKNCGYYRVYKLIPTCWYSSYCFDPSTEENNDYKFDPNVTVEIRDATEDNTDLVFECRFETDSEFLYNISWYGDNISWYGDRVLLKSTDLLTVDTLSQHYLHQEELPELDITIHCEVEQHILGNETKTNLTRFSKGKFIGFEIEERIINIARGDTSVHQVTLKTIIPARCSASFMGGSCALMIQQQEEVSDACLDWNVAFNNRCQMKMGNTESSGTMTFDVSIRSQITTKDMDTTRILRLQVNSNDKSINRIWKGFKLKDIWVHVYDASHSWANKECSAEADPHMCDFNGRCYECQMEGMFILYRHTELPMEVQVRTMPCSPWWDGPYCVCAVAVRAGEDVFLYSVCEQPAFIGKTKCNDDILEVKEITMDGSYKVFLPTGTVVTIIPLWRHIVNVKITPSPKDFGKTSGLCGVLSDDRTSGFILRNGTLSNDNRWEPNDFSNSWRTPPKENLFDPDVDPDVDVDVSGTIDQNIELCVCPFNDIERGDSPQQTDAETDCSQKMYNTCDFDELLETKESNFKCTIIPSEANFRRRREVLRRLKRAKPRQRRSSEEFSSSGNWTEEEAEKFCRSAFDNETDCIKFTDVDVNSSVSKCIKDIEMTGTTLYTDMAVNLFGRSCITQLENKGKPKENDTNEVSSEMKAKIRKAFCPNKCHGNGDCVEGKCQCYSGFVFGDCSINENDAVQALDIFNDGTCDTESMDCSEINLYGGDFYDGGGLTCRIRSSIIKPNDEPDYVDQSDLPGRRISRFEVSCILPSSDFVKLGSAYYISVSNNGEVFGNEQEMLVYSHRHVTHMNIDGNDVFKLKVDSCYIDGEFYGNGSVSASNSSLICDTNESQYNWTIECMAGNFGIGCQEVCQCNISHSESCSKTDGTCTCMEGWHGKFCNSDIDECSSNPCPNNSICTDTPGSYMCTCDAGYRKKDMQCLESKSFKLTMKLDVDEEWKSEGDAEHMSVIKKLTLSMTSYYAKYLADEFLGLDIKAVRHGSLDVDHAVYLRFNENAGFLLISAIRESETLEYNDQLVNVISISTVDMNGEAVVLSDENSCTFFTALEPCPAQTICEKSVDGTFQCIHQIEVDDKDVGFAMIIAVSVVSVVILVAISIFVFVRVKSRANKIKDRRENRSESETEVPNYFPTIIPMKNDAWKCDNNSYATGWKKNCHTSTDCQAWSQ